MSAISTPSRRGAVRRVSARPTPSRRGDVRRGFRSPSVASASFVRADPFRSSARIARAQGRAQLISNINACQAVADAVRTTLGPRGLDKLVARPRGVTISNDGATIMGLLEVEHPAAKTLVDISMSQVRGTFRYDDDADRA